MSKQEPRKIPKPELITKIGLDVFPAFAMLAGMELEIFTILALGPLTTEEIAERAGLQPERVRHLLSALTDAKLLEKQDDRYANSEEANVFLVKGLPTYLGVARDFFRITWTAAFQTAESIRSGKPQVRWLSLSPEEKQAYLDGLRPSARGVARHLVGVFDFSGYKTLADVAGGSGELAISIAKQCPHIHATVIDLPDVVPIAETFIRSAGAEKHVDAIEGDVFDENLSGAYDAVVIRNFLQMLSADEAQRAMTNIAKIVAPGGSVFLVELTLDDSREGPIEAIRYGLLFVNLFDNSIAPHTESDYRGFLKNAGLEGFSRIPTARGLSMMKASKPV